jgi:hypothetical protein
MNADTKIVIRVAAKCAEGQQPLEAIKAVAAEMQAEAKALNWDAETIALIPVSVGLACLAAC